MITEFPKHTGYQGLFAVGFRKNPSQPTQTQRVGMAILKRTYDIDPSTATQEGTLSPSETPLPLFMQDVKDNQLVNSDFENNQEDFGESDAKEKPGAWKEQNITATLELGGEGVQLAGSDPAGRIVQTLTFDEPLGGRPFRFSFSAHALVGPARIKDAHLEADGHTLCTINQAVTTSMVRYNADGVWPANVTATTMQVVLTLAVDPSNPTLTRTTRYDRVQIEERTRLTQWDSSSLLRREHDLAPFKPEGDVIVLGFADVSTPCSVNVNGVSWLVRTPASTREKALFGWQPRDVGDRESDRGTFSEDPAHYPSEWPVVDPNKDPLPAKYSNRFLNGYLRKALKNAGLTQMPYLPPAALIEIVRGGSVDYAFRLRGEVVTASYSVYTGAGPDEEQAWQTVPVTMNLDTLVVEPENNRCYAVWRGVWPFDTHTEDAYRRLVVSASP